jgi:nitrate reductase delta subunit
MTIVGSPPLVALDDSQRRVAHMAASVLLDYPDEEDLGRLPAVRAALPLLPEPVAEPLRRFLDAADGMGVRRLAEHYVETFDRRRRCTLYLSYYDAGDTRKRGAAILAFRDALAATGWELTRKELPDFLPVVLELSARSEEDLAGELLASHRDGLEVVRTALGRIGSPYESVLEALCLTLPEIDDETRERYVSLVTQGPPAEMVGIAHTLPFPQFGTAKEARS